MAGVRINDAQLRQLKRFMDECCCTCTDEWLVACVNWIQETFPGANLDSLKRELQEQWKDSSLEEMESCCLPPDLAGQRLTKLPGKYGLQINSIRDIGESSYNQWNRMKKLENENASVAATDSNEYKASWEPKPKSCLYLTMTDGQQVVYGMEMQPIPTLKLDLKPGTKVVLMGPIECRRGVLHLRSNNVRVLGGEVEDLLEANRHEKILADILKINPADRRTQVQPHTVAEDRTRVQRTQVPNTNVNRDLGGSATMPISSTTPEEDMEAFGEDDDDIFMQIDEEAVINSAKSSSSTTTLAIASNSTSSHSATAPFTSQKNVPGAKFTEEIEDFEDDPNFITRTNSSSSSNFRGHTEGASRNNPTALVSVKTEQIPKTVPTSDTGATTKRSKPTFIPPTVKTATASASTSAGNKATSTTSSSYFTSKKGTSVNPAPAKNVSLPEFKSAKAALTSTTVSGASSSSVSGNGSKQLNILQYMQPMPMTIDPPTPERQIKRRKRSVDEGASLGEDQQRNQIGSIQVKTEPVRDTEVTEAMSYHQTEAIEEENDMLCSDIRDESLMRIVDEAVEKSLSERFDFDTDQILVPSGNPSHSDAIDPTTTTKIKDSFPVKVSEHPYVFIKFINEKFLELAAKRKVVKVKACISTVVSSIQVENGCWTLKVCVNDGTGYLNCLLSSNLLNDIITFTPSEMKAIKASKSKEGKKRIAEAMNGLASTLLHLNSIFSIEIGEEPVIVEINDLVLHHSASLKEKLSQIGI